MSSSVLSARLRTWAKSTFSSSVNLLVSKALAFSVPFVDSSSPSVFGLFFIKFVLVLKVSRLSASPAISGSSPTSPSLPCLSSSSIEISQRRVHRIHTGGRMPPAKIAERHQPAQEFTVIQLFSVSRIFLNLLYSWLDAARNVGHSKNDCKSWTGLTQSWSGCLTNVSYPEYLVAVVIDLLTMFDRLSCTTLTNG